MPAGPAPRNTSIWSLRYQGQPSIPRIPQIKPPVHSQYIGMSIGVCLCYGGT